MELKNCLWSVEMIVCRSLATTHKKKSPDCMGITLTCALVMIIGLVMVAPSAVADEVEEVSNNIDAVAPLRSLLVQVQENYPGQVLEVELEKEEYDKRKIWVYEIKLLTTNGNVLKLEYDAVNLELLKLKGKLDN
jgi:uncharacterized membrane protein YkoI